MAKTGNANNLFADIKKEKNFNLKKDKTKEQTPIPEEPIDNNGESTIKQLPAKDLIPFSDEKLRLNIHTGDSYDRLKESIQQNGIINPVIVRKKDSKYEIIAGHNRVQICKDLKIDVPCLVRENMDDEEAMRICIDTNLLNRQRSDFKPTQFAYMLKVRFEKEKHQGIAYEDASLTGAQVGAQFGLDRRTIHRYIKLNLLTDKAKEKLDAGKLTIRVGYDLAFLPASLQNYIMDNYDKYKISESGLQKIKQQIKQESLEDEEALIDLAKNILPHKNDTIRKFEYKNIKKYIPSGLSESSAEEYVIRALKYYREAGIEKID